MQSSLESQLSHDTEPNATVLPDAEVTPSSVVRRYSVSARQPSISCVDSVLMCRTSTSGTTECLAPRHHESEVLDMIADLRMRFTALGEAMQAAQRRQRRAIKIDESSPTNRVPPPPGLSITSNVNAPCTSSLVTLLNEDEFVSEACQPCHKRSSVGSQPNLPEPEVKPTPEKLKDASQLSATLNTPSPSSKLFGANAPIQTVFNKVLESSREMGAAITGLCRQQETDSRKILELKRIVQQLVSDIRIYAGRARPSFPSLCLSTKD